MKQQVQNSIFEQAQLMHDFIGQATNEKFDMRADRLCDLFYQMRHSDLAQKWPSMAGLRRFLEETIDDNPYVPATIRKTQQASKATAPAPRQFIEQWAKEVAPIDTLPIDPKEFIETIDTVPEVRDAFVRNNHHDSNYFYTKYAEWHISLKYIEQLKAKTIVDIGAAYDGFAKTLVAVEKETKITMLDMAFKPGLHQVSTQISKLGTDAADMSAIETGSIDMVCSHNAFEHFAGNSDVDCLREVERILKPGGVALITPFFFALKHSITVNPAACFLFETEGDLVSKICTELTETGGRLDYNHKIISPYARRYDLQTTRKRILGSTPKLTAKLRTCVFDPMPNQVFSSTHVSGVSCRPDVFNYAIFYFLELTKS